VCSPLCFSQQSRYAHGEQILVFPVSFALLFVVAIAICIVRWHRLVARLITVAVLLVVNIALWFSPVLPQTFAGLAGYDLRKALFILLSVPLALGVVAAWAFRRIMKRGLTRRCT
jgi:hypothetical protein